jgi:hypothetical protein
MENKTIEDSFKKSIITESGNLLKDYGEITVDNLINNETFKEIPVIGTLLSFYKIGIGIREKFIIEKVYKFLFQLKDIPEKDKTNFLDKCERDKNFNSNITEKLLIILDRIDDSEKATIIGNLFKKLIEEKISLNDFLYLSNAIDKIHIIDLKFFCYTDNFNRGEELREYWLSQEREGLDALLGSLGLLLQKIDEDKIQRNHTNELELNFRITYVKSRLGRLLIEYAFE